MMDLLLFGLASTLLPQPIADCSQLMYLRCLQGLYQSPGAINNSLSSIFLSLASLQFPLPVFIERIVSIYLLVLFACLKADGMLRNVGQYCINLSDSFIIFVRYQCWNLTLAFGDAAVRPSLAGQGRSQKKFVKRCIRSNIPGVLQHHQHIGLHYPH